MLRNVTSERKCNTGTAYTTMFGKFKFKSILFIQNQ